MIHLPQEPVRGQPIPWKWGADVIRYLRAITPRPSPTVWPQIGAGGTTFLATPGRGGSAAGRLYPFDVLRGRTDPDNPDQILVTFVPGTANNLLPDNMFEEFALPAHGAVTLAKCRCLTNGQTVTGCTLVVDDELPPAQVPTPFGLPPSVDILTCVLAEGQWWRQIPLASIVLTGREQFRVDRDPPAQPGQTPYTPYYAWALQQPA